jgi:glycosyltransferase involved in cell wall biosynthesis
MHVVIVSDFASVNGGAATVAIESARGLAEAGVAVTFVAAIGPVSPKLKHEDIRVALLELPDVKSLNPLAGALAGIWNRKSAKAFRDILATHDPARTIVHFHQWTKALSPSVIGMAARLGFPVVIAGHDFFSCCPNGGYFNFRTGKTCTLKPMSVACMATACDRQSHAHKIIRLIRQIATNRAQARVKRLHYAFVSDYALKIARPFLRRDATFHVLYNMIDQVKGEPRDPALAKHLLVVGRMTEDKGVLGMARAARSANMPIRFVGDGAMADAVRKANPEAVVTGWVPHETVPNEIANARAIVTASAYIETGPLVTADAMAVGVPSILSRASGLARLIRHGENGLLVEPGDEDGLASLMRRLKDDAFLRKLGANAYQDFWKAPLTLEAHIKGLLAIYCAVLA